MSQKRKKIRTIRDIRREKEPEIDEEEIKKNINNVLNGKPLTCPLAVLNRECISNGDCDFIKQYEDEFNSVNKDKISKEKREYRNKPEIKEWRKEYNQRPEVKARRKKYDNRPEIKKRKKEYNKKNKKKYKKYSKRYYKRNKEEISRKSKEKYQNHRELGLCGKCLRKAKKDRCLCIYHSRKSKNKNG